MKIIAKEHLDQVILPFWKALKDETKGGYMGEVSFDLETNQDAVKGCILNSRILWFFANAYTVAKDEESLAFATHAYEFLKNYALDQEYGGVYWSLNADGTVYDDLKHTYNQAFAIYALSAYYEASQNPEALEIAHNIFETIETKCASTIGYNESFNRYFEPTSNEKLSDNKEVTESGVIASKTMNTILHVLEAYTEFYKVTQDEKVKEKLVALLDLVATKIYNEKEHKLEVFFDEQYNSIVDMHSFGHDIEAAWLIDRACEVLGEQKWIDLFAPIDTAIVDKVIEEAFEDCLLYNERVGQKVDKTRVWWVQAETVVGLVNEYEKTKQEEYLAKAKSTLEYILTKMVDTRAHSEWHWELDENDQDTAKKCIVEQWKCPYHNGRMIFEIMKRGI